MRTILLTGATGLIGAHLLRTFSEDDKVVCISRSKPVAGVSNTVTIDLGKDWDTGLLPGQIDTVIHLAQSEYFRDFPHHAEDVFRVNTLSTVKLLDYARIAGATTFVLASSGGVYGGGERSFSEDATISANKSHGFYLGTRLCSEIVAECYTKYMNVICLRFFFVYGPGQRADMLIPRLVTSVQRQLPITLRGQQGILINPIFVDDAVKAVSAATTIKGSYKINIAGQETLSIRAIAETIGDALSVSPIFNIESAGEPQNLVGDTARMSQLLGAPCTTFANGLTAYLKSLAA